MQGKFEAVEHQVWEKAYAKRDFKPETIEAIVKEAGLDMAKYKADKEGPCKKIIAQDQNDLRVVGVSGTPAFYVNGRFISGARPIDQFKAVIDEELKKANASIAKGEASVATYYDKMVYKKGLKKLAPVK